MLTVEELHAALAVKISEKAPIPQPHPSESTDPMLAYRREQVVEQERSNEPLVRPDVEGIATYSYYACADGQNPPYYRRLAGSLAHVWLRRGVVDKLQVVNQALRRVNLELLVLDGYRTLACQRELWTRFITLGREMFPDYDKEQLQEYALGNRPLPAEIDRADRTTWPTHSTGGSVDLTLRTLAGAPVYMGGVFDDPAFAQQAWYGYIDPPDDPYKS